MPWTGGGIRWPQAVHVNHFPSGLEVDESKWVNFVNLGSNPKYRDELQVEQDNEVEEGEMSLDSGQKSRGKLGFNGEEVVSTVITEVKDVGN